MFARAVGGVAPVFLTSSEDGRGRQELLDYIEQLNRLPVGGSDDDTEAQ